MPHNTWQYRTGQYIENIHTYIHLETYKHMAARRDDTTQCRINENTHTRIQNIQYCQARWTDIQRNTYTHKIHTQADIQTNTTGIHTYRDIHAVRARQTVIPKHTYIQNQHTTIHTYGHKQAHIQTHRQINHTLAHNSHTTKYIH